MTTSSSGIPPFHRVLPILLAIPIALAVTMIEPAMSVPILIGGLILVLAFLSPEAGLYLLVFSMLLGPEVIIGAMGSGASLGRGVTLRFDDLVLSLVACGWLARTAVSDNPGRFVRTPLNRPILLYTAACVFATLMGILLGNVKPFSGFFFLLKYYEYFLLFFMVINIVKSEKQIHRLILASFITFLLVTLYALAQIPSGVRVSAPFEGATGEPNTLGGYLVFMMAMITGFLIIPGSIPSKVPLIGMLVLAALALQATLSRSSFLGAIVVSLVVLEFCRRRSIGLFSILLIGFTCMLFLTPASVIERVNFTFTQEEDPAQIQIAGLRLDTSTSDRIRSWQDAFEIFLQTPLWGTGVTGGPFMDAMFPRVLTETGLLGMAAFLYLLGAIFHLGKTTYQTVTDPFAKGLALGFLLGFIGLVFHAIGANTFIVVRIMEPFWLYAALLTKCLIIRNTSQEVLVQPFMDTARGAIKPAFGQRFSANGSS